MNEFEDIINLLPKIKIDRKYWLVRTSAGLFYEDYRQNNFVAIGYNNISVFDLKNANDTGRAGIKDLINKLRVQQKDNKRPQHTIFQQLRFLYDIKKDDIVIIPSKDSNQISFGRVVETPIYTVEIPNKPDPNKCTYIKRKKVEWLLDIPRYKLEPSLYKLLFSHHTISDAKSYSEVIDRTINSFYIKGDTANIVIEVTTHNGINAKELFKMGSNLLEIVDDFSKYYNLQLDTDSIEIKIELQSPGKIQLSGKAKAGIILIGLLVIGSVGGGFKIKVGDTFQLDLSTVGAVQKIIDYKNSSHDREVMDTILKKHANDLKIKESQDLVKVIKQLSDNKEKN